ncbi:MAG: prenyltransferase/squalene oxidase repeat-containing protein [Candidatus Thorarchaeota archaeon]
MKKYLCGVLIVLLLFAYALPIQMAAAASETEIEDAIELGLDWLVEQQYPDGSWHSSDMPVEAITAFVLIKLQDRAYELGKNPFQETETEPDYYEYAPNVNDGWDYLFGRLSTMDLTGYVEDLNENDIGIYCLKGFSSYVYSTGITLMALAASKAPGKESGIDFDGDSSVDTFGQIAQDVVEWLDVAQLDSGPQRGAWSYSIFGRGDNSITGYAVLGLAAGEGFGCTIRQWVKDELSIWIDYIQNDDGPGDDGPWPDDQDGGSGYHAPSAWVNQLKTGNLIFEMTFCGDETTSTRFIKAMDWVERNWQQANYHAGWGYLQTPAYYQAMYCLMKGFEYSQIELIDLDLDDTPEHDWYQEFAEVLVNQQYQDGHWATSPCYAYPTHVGRWSGEVLSTIWALLTLERIAPPPPVITVFVDIMPQSWPNPINTESKGVIPLAICGTEEFDVTTIDPASIRLTIEGVEDGVAPLRWSYENVATPYEGEEGGGHEEGPDLYMDLVLHFDTQEVVIVLSLADFKGSSIALIVTGNLIEEEGGTPILGQDYVWVQADKKNEPKT